MLIMHIPVSFNRRQCALNAAGHNIELALKIFIQAAYFPLWPR